MAIDKCICCLFVIQKDENEDQVSIDMTTWEIYNKLLN
jgi:hypothetical protein